MTDTVRPDDERLRLGRVLAGLTMAAAAIREAVKHGSPSGGSRQPLDEAEHDGHWLSRPQVKTAIDAAADVEAILWRLKIRMDARCQGTLGKRPSWMGVDQYDPCRCTLPRDHEGDHACEHTDAAAAKASPS